MTIESIFHIRMDYLRTLANNLHTTVRDRQGLIEYRQQGRWVKYAQLDDVGVHTTIIHSCAATRR